MNNFATMDAQSDLCCMIQVSANEYQTHIAPWDRAVEFIQENHPRHLSSVAKMRYKALNSLIRRDALRKRKSQRAPRWAGLMSAWRTISGETTPAIESYRRRQQIIDSI